METNLNLSDPKVIEQLKASDVMSDQAAVSKAELTSKSKTDAAPVQKEVKAKSKKEAQDIEDKIAKLRKPSTFSMKLSGEEIAVCERAAMQLGTDWKSWLDAEIRKQLFTTTVATPRITMPSHGKRVMGPTNMERLNR